ncbi:hypothetical protein FB446DRAFT_794280 [Lentinula raphanica]|nr:hypothetical protein FB446DRAFT_794280 [Lentinula raphanica]
MFLADMKSTSFSAKDLARLSAAEEMTKASQALQAAEGQRIKAQLKLEKAHTALTEVYDLSNAGFNVDLAPFSSPVEVTKAQLVKAKEEAHTAEKTLSEAYDQISVAYEKLQRELHFASAPALAQRESSPAPTFAQDRNPPGPASPSKAAVLELPQNILLTPTKIRYAERPVDGPAPAHKAPQTPLAKNLSIATTAAATPRTPASKIRSGSVLVATPTASQSEEHEWYVIYHGRGGCQGLFEGYTATAKALSSDYTHRLMKRFASKAEATTSYKECESCGILELLRPLPKSKEIFIVIEGVLIFPRLDEDLSVNGITVISDDDDDNDNVESAN